MAVMALGALTGVGAIWDTIWWHRYVGRHAFWIPPHTLVVIGSGVALCIALSMWFLYREKIWRAFSICLLLIIATQPVDNLWHLLFGIEEPSTIWMYWSPPHLLIAVALISFWAVGLAASRRFLSGNVRTLFISLNWAFLLSAIFVEMRPLQPVGSIYQLLGFWGAGVIAGMLIGILLLVQYFDSGKNACQRVMLGYFCIHVVVTLFVVWMFLVNPEISISVLWQTFFGGYNAIPIWMQMVALFGVAIWLDRFTKVSQVVRATIAGGLYGVVHFAFSSHFLSVEFQFSSTQAVEAILASVIGGLSAYVIFSFYSFYTNEKRSTHH